MTSEQALYGHKIAPTNRLSLSDQVYDILLEEIQAGHWRVGERLPSIADIARLSGLSNMPVQQAFQRLGREGYLRLSGRGGTYLEAILPGGRAPAGAIGVAALTHPEFGLMPSPHAQWVLHKLLEAIPRRGYTAEVLSLKIGDPWDRIDSIQGPFQERVKGVISLRALPTHYPCDLPADRLPSVCLFSLPPLPRGYPGVTLDTREGAFILTRRLIELGHRRILFLQAKGGDREERLGREQGYAQALAEKGLPPVAETVRAIPPSDLRKLRDLLLRHGDATAIICGTESLAEDIIAMAGLLDLDVPGQLSVAAIESKPMNLGPAPRRLAGIQFDFDRAIEIGIDMLIEQIQTRRACISSVCLQPFLEEGQTLAPPGAVSPRLRPGCEGIPIS